MANTPAHIQRRWSLRVYILGLTGLLIAALAAGAVYTGWTAQRDAHRAADDGTSYAAKAAATAIAKDVKELQDGIVSTATTPGLAKLFSVGASCTLSFSGVGLFPSGHLDLVRNDGSVACSSLPKANGASYASASWFKDALQRSTLSAPYLDPVSRARVAVSAAPIPGEGMVVGAINLSPAATELTSTYGGSSRYEFMLTTADGTTVLARSINAAQWSGRSLADTAFARNTGSGERRDVDGVSRIYGAATVAGTGWHVYAGEESAVALDAASSLARQDAAVLIGGAVVVLIALLVVYRRITRPITRLEAAVHAARPGSGFEPIAVSGPREVAALSASFNRLMAEVELELTQRREAEGRLSASLAEVEIVDAQRRRLLDKLVTAQEEERRRIASDVHDDSVQLIAAAIMRVSLIRQHPLDEGISAQLAKLQENLEGAVERLRNLLFQLRPPSLDREGLTAALTEYFGQWAGDAHIAYQINNRLTAEPPPNTRVVLFRIAQEALTNVRKHSQAGTVTIVLEDHAEGARMTIVDDGIGIDSVPSDGSPIGHLGLVGMRERAELAGGWCKAYGAPSRGTVVEVWLPLAAQTEEVVA
jgi:signal transduction histidine kinase